MMDADERARLRALPARDVARIIDALDAAELERDMCRDTVRVMREAADRGAEAYLRVTERAEAAELERDALRAIVEGRTTPPTDAEIAAHDAAGGRWRCVVPSSLHMCNDALHGHAARWHRDTVCEAGWSSVWWALDAQARPCAWPVVEGGAR